MLHVVFSILLLIVHEYGRNLPVFEFLEELLQSLPLNALLHQGKHPVAKREHYLLERLSERLQHSLTNHSQEGVEGLGDVAMHRCFSAGQVELAGFFVGFTRPISSTKFLILSLCEVVALLPFLPVLDTSSFNEVL